MVVSTPGSGTTPGVQAANPQDFESIVEATTWNGLHTMVSPTVNQLPFSVQKIMFLKAKPNFVNNLFLDITGTASSTDIQLSIRDNSATSGEFQNAALGTIPAFVFPSHTYSGTGLNLQVSLLRTGRFNVALRIVDNSGNYSIFEMDWIVL